MAVYKHGNLLKPSQDAAFDRDQTPGDRAAFSGIFRCPGCGREVAANEGQPLPPQNHHQHGPGQGFIKWRLTVYAEHQP